MPPAPKATASKLVREWLGVKTRRAAWLCGLGAAGLIPLGLLCVWLTFWSIYLVIYAGFQWMLPLSHTGVMVASAVIVVLLFIGNATTSRAYLDQLEFETDDGTKVAIRVARGLGYGWMSAFAGPKTARSFVKLLTTLLFIGPRLLATAWGLARKAIRLRALDIEGCGRVLAMLLAAGSRVPFAAILQKHPTLDPQATFAQLRDLDGIIFLPSEPAGLTLSPDLQTEYVEWRTASAQ